MKLKNAQFAIVTLAAATFMASCATPGKAPAPSQAFRPVASADIPLFSDPQDKDALLASAAKSMEYLQSGAAKTTYTIDGREITSADLRAALQAFTEIYKSAKTQDELNAAIRERFSVYRTIGTDGKGKVVFSSYYEPVLEASLTKDATYKYPIYARPADLVDVNLETFNADKYKGEKLSGRLDGTKLVPYWSREFIDIYGFLQGQGLELAYFKHPLEVMDLHVEGSGRIRLPDGTMKKAGFAGTNGLQFRGVISALISAGLIEPKNQSSHEQAKTYIDSHPDMAPFVLAWNKRYTFFKLSDLSGPDDGAIGTIGRSLTGGRSIAVDPKYVPLGSLVFIQLPLPAIGPDGKAMKEQKQVSKFVLCQDTGGAILGPGRVDYFSGTGDEAGELARNVWNDGALYLLLLKEAPRK